MRIVVYHGGYGCDTGCCGHWVDIEDVTPEEEGALRDNYGRWNTFDFGHPFHRGEEEAYARKLVEDAFGRDHCADLDWSNVLSYDDC